MKNIFLSLYCISILIVIISCEKVETKAIRGNIIGFVELFDDKGYIVSDKSSVSVSIENTSYKTSTNAYGKYKFSGIPTGSYKINFTKENYSFFTRYNNKVAGGEVPIISNAKLFKTPSLEIEKIEISSDSTKLTVSGEINQTNPYSYFIAMNDSSIVSFDNYKMFNYDYFFSFSYTKQFMFDKELEYAPFDVLDTVYLAIYLYHPADEGYYDFEKDDRIYPSYFKITDAIEHVIGK